MNKKFNDVIVIGFALFAMFLGAGNLIFPPTIGHITGTRWPLALLGFLVTGVGMPVLGIISMGKCEGDLSKFTKSLNTAFGTAFIVIVMLIIGPLLAIPRTAATTYEIAIRPFGISWLNSILVSFIFFSITLFFVLTPNNVIDRVGKFLTPLLLIVLGLLIVKGIITPIASIKNTGEQQSFLRGFKEGYQTMDALGSMILATIVISGIAAKGYKNRKDALKMTVYTGLVACLGLGFVYGGLVYVGATASKVLPESLTRTELVVESSALLWSEAGKIVLGLSIGLACLTTAIGLTATAGEYFSTRFKDDISYRATVIIICVVSFFLSNFGVENIIRFAAPMLEVVYPVAIVLILMNLFVEHIPNRYFFVGAVIGTLCVSVVLGVVEARDLINNFLMRVNLSKKAISFDTTIRVIKQLPLEKFGFPWIFPAIGGSIIMGFGYMLMNITKTAPSIKDNKRDKNK